MVKTFFRSSYHKILTLSESYYHTILSYSEFEYQTVFKLWQSYYQSEHFLESFNEYFSKNADRIYPNWKFPSKIGKVNIHTWNR